MPEGPGSCRKGLRCTRALRADRSRNCAAVWASSRGWQRSIPNHLGLLCSPHTFKRRRKFENSQPPSSFPLLLCLTPHTLLVPCYGLLPSPTHAILMFQASPPRPSPNLPDWPRSVAGEGRQLRRLPEASSSRSGTRKRERESTARGGHNPAAEEPEQLVHTLQRPSPRPGRRHSTHRSSPSTIASSQ